jgi:hypothetical protein
METAQISAGVPMLAYKPYFSVIAIMDFIDTIPAVSIESLDKTVILFQ